MPGLKYKNRSWTLYFPSEEDLDRWQELAKAAKLPLSHWIFETMELHLAESPQEGHDLAKEVSQFKEEIATLHEELRIKSKILQQYETELFNLRHREFLQSPSEIRGFAQLSEELVELLKKGKTWRSDDLLKALNLDPKNKDSISILLNQLQGLQDFGLVEESTKGWRWVK